MSRARRYVPWIVLGTGMLALFVGDLGGLTGDARLAVVLAGAALSFVGIVAAETSATARCGDERADQYRAGHFGFVVLGALLISMLLVALMGDVTFEAENVLAGSVLVGLFAFMGSLYRQRWTA
jgi:hypothetical protein